MRYLYIQIDVARSIARGEWISHLEPLMTDLVLIELSDRSLCIVSGCHVDEAIAKGVARLAVPDDTRFVHAADSWEEIEELLVGEALNRCC